ncbi:MAG: DedA family protein [Rhodospirillaceae bacterium]|nr:MAG: DedA family protein [Rhodospirillaceae bacterium]
MPSRLFFGVMLEDRRVQEFLDTFFGTFHDLETFLRTYGYFAILLLTFLEGETIVILAGIAAAQGLMSPLLVGVSGFTGSFLGDQFYYTIGRYYGQPLLERWPHLRPRIEWAFRLVRKYQDLYILSFRFIYGVRNISPLWATVFTSGGYFFGHAIERLLGTYQEVILISIVGVLVAIGVGTMAYRRIKRRR